ncbi:arginyl-tRNA synthetase [Natranaerovirga hydrolytica]|uniref:Arginine--tRNA ligase n=1 Tax=Natranaerovirga hydrolytica TaxID=680378 RepID=A0A4R1M3U6_9FIRM|nr:arginine--tRNA ligase [Natranaerovirga hydrolytica]TCK86778.1 arginyl-tRNA synthetase [Natranaerovirga hydrolytica]
MRNLIVKYLEDHIEDLSYEEINDVLEIPPKTDMGDYAFPCFALAKSYKKAPHIIAQEIAQDFKAVDFIEKTQPMGPYINFFVSKEKYAQLIIEDYKNTQMYGQSNIGANKSIVIDYSSPNIAKKFHIGHLRTTIIGNALYNIFNMLGYKSVGINHLGDWGTQFGKLIVAYKKWGNKDKVLENGIDELTSIYVKFHDEAEKNPELEDEAREWFVKMELGNEEALELWKWFKEISLNEFERVYKMLNIEFDSYAGESFYIDKAEGVIEEINSKGILESSEGAKVVNLDEYDMPPCLITKKDGSSLYATRDIAAAMYRKKTYDFHKCLYVTGLEQKLHFSQWFKVIEKMGHQWSKDLEHVPYGLVRMEEGKLSSRKGNVILVEDLLNQSTDKTKAIIEEKNPHLDNKENVAKQIGVGAIIFNDLYNSRIKDVVFSWDKVLNFDGETGPYVQYTHTRAASVLSKANYEFNKDDEVDYGLYTEASTFALLKEINKFPQVIIDSANKLEPYLISRYVVDLAQAFNKFYHDNQIIVEDNKVKNARLLLVYMVKDIIKSGLGLIGIEAPEKM